MFSYIIRRILSLIPMILIITFLIYLGLELTPGDAVSHLIPPDAMANVSPEQLEALRESFGLNDPFIVRYFRWLGEMGKGNFGYSISSGVKISEIVMRNLSATLELSIAALLISTILGSILGLVSALKKGTLADNVLTVAGMVGVSIPQFFFGLVCILLFVLKWKLFPIRLLLALGLFPLHGFHVGLSLLVVLHYILGQTSFHLNLLSLCLSHILSICFLVLDVSNLLLSLGSLLLLLFHHSLIPILGLLLLFLCSTLFLLLMV